jgi:hypothetical protein
MWCRNVVPGAQLPRAQKLFEAPLVAPGQKALPKVLVCFSDSRLSETQCLRGMIDDSGDVVVVDA